MRICLAKHVVDLMRQGMNVQDACVNGIKKALQLDDLLGGGLNVLAMDRNGVTASASIASDVFYCYQDESLPEPVKKPSICVKI
jgi:isoaspartyl peptidase/L-asparaginase-like protein (Ntn-hydrolase superfamily)